MQTQMSYMEHNQIPSLYQGLSVDTTQHQIRIFEVQPGSHDDPVECTLKVASLDDKSLEFTALSYVWGIPSETATIVVNRHPVSVTTSLASALRNFRNLLSQETILRRILWVDAVCINQHDPAERIFQVQMMGDIYSSATDVFVFLGDGNRHTDFALDRMNSAWHRSGHGPAWPGGDHRGDCSQTSPLQASVVATSVGAPGVCSLAKRPMVLLRVKSYPLGRPAILVPAGEKAMGLSRT